MDKIGLNEDEIVSLASKWLNDNHEAIANRIKKDMELAIAQAGGDTLYITGRAIDISFTITLDTICQCLGHVIAANNRSIAKSLK